MQQVKEQKALHNRLCSLSNISKEQQGAPVQALQQYPMQGRVVDL